MTPIERRTSFHFSDYLGRLPGSFVYERFLKRCGPERKIVSASTIQDILARFASEKNLKDAFSRLSPGAQYAVSLAYLFGERGVSCEQFQGRALKNDSPGLDDECIGSFLVYAAEDTQGKRFYVGFEEFEPKLRGLFCRTIVEKTKTRPDKEIRQSAPGLCVNDIAAVVSLASQGKLTKTKIGQFGKASEQLTARILHGGRPPYDWIANRVRPATFAVEYACRKGLIYLRDDRYVPVHSRMCAWTSRPLPDLHADIVDFAFSYLSAWRRTMVDELFSGPENPWLSSLAFGEDPGVMASSVKLLAYLGLVEFQKNSGDLLFRASRPGSAGRDAVKPGQAPRVMILPDFTAMLPQEIAPEHLYWFSRIGRIESLDKVYKGKIDREVIFDSLSAGIEGAAVLKLLDQWQASANIRETVREWVREFLQVFMETGAIVVSAEEKVTKRLSSYGLLAGYLEPVRGHCVFRVAKGKEDLVAGILASMGFDHRAPLMQRHEKPAEHLTLSDLLDSSGSAGTERSPVVTFEKIPQAPPLVLQQGKYSSRLKALEITELMHVIEYALLMGNRLRIEYGGSPGVRKGVYQVRPLQCQKGPGSGLEAESGRACAKKIFVLDRIMKIGVEPLHE